MKILLLTDRMECGGAETHIAELARGLLQAEDEVFLVSSGGALADQLEATGVRQYRLPLCTHNPIKLLLLRRKLHRLCRHERFDVLHAHARIPALLLSGCRRKGCLEVVSVHARFRASFPLPWLCNWGERTVAVSEDLRLYVRNTYRIPPERISVIGNGIDVQRFSPPIPDPRQETGSPDAPVHILFASRLDADCSLVAELLLRILPALSEEFPTVVLSIVGGGSKHSALSSKADALNQRLGRNAVMLHGRVENLPPLLQKTDIFVGVSRAAMEAAACGCAVLLAGNEGMLGILEQSVFEEALHGNLCARGYPAPTEDALLSDLLYLLRTPLFRRRCAREARHLITTRCNVTEMCDRIRALYLSHLHRKPQKTVTVGGYFGCGNLGDDAILSGTLTAFRTNAPEIRLIALSGTPRKTRTHLGIDAVWRYNPIGIIRALSRSDCFLCGGGSLLQNTTSGRSLFYYLTLLRFARLFCSTGLFASGIGPLHGERATQSCLRVLTSCRYLSLRDAASYRLLRGLGVSPEHLYCGTDAALWLPPPPPGRALTVKKENHIPRRKRLLTVILRGSLLGTSFAPLFPSALRIFCNRHSLLPLFCIFDAKEDRMISHMIAKHCGGIPLQCGSAEDILAILGQSEAVITMRLHGLILSGMAGTPTLVLSADEREEKLTAFSKELGQPLLPLEELSVGEFVESMETLLAEKAKLGCLLADSVNEMQKKAEKDLANIIGMLYNKDN